MLLDTSPPLHFSEEYFTFHSTQLFDSFGYFVDLDDTAFFFF